MISGAEDTACPPEVGRELAEGIPGAEFACIEGAAHLGNLERPEAVTALIRSQLTKEAA